MEPLAALDDAVLRDLRGVIFDIDDTLTTRGRLEPGAYAALWALHARGLALFALTGRPLGWTDAAAALWPIDAAIGENGAGFARRDGSAVVIEYVEAPPDPARLEAIRAQVAAAHPSIALASDQPARRCDLAFDIGERVRLDRASIAALVRTVERCGARCVVSSVHAHAIVGGWDKAKGAVFAIERTLGIDCTRELDRWLFVGDSGNDAAAFARFPCSVGVANVREHLAHLPVPPRYVTRAERGSGFIELTERIAAARDHGA